MAAIELDDSDVVRAFRELQQASIEELTIGLNEACIPIVADAKRNVTRHMGQLGNSITHEVSNQEALVGTNVEHAPYVEYGTALRSNHPRASRRRHAPFSRKAIENLTRYAQLKGATDPEQAAWRIAKAIYKKGGLDPKPFLEPAAEKNKEHIVRSLQNALLRAIGKVAK